MLIHKLNKKWKKNTTRIKKNLEYNEVIDLMVPFSQVEFFERQSHLIKGEFLYGDWIAGVTVRLLWHMSTTELWRKQLKKQ